MILAHCCLAYVWGNCKKNCGGIYWSQFKFEVLIDIDEIPRVVDEFKWWLLSAMVDAYELGMNDGVICYGSEI